MLSRHKKKLKKAFSVLKSVEANQAAKFEEYQFRPVEFAEEVLGISTLTEPQKEGLRALHKPPYKVLVPAAHNCGKTFQGAVALIYWHKCFQPSVVISTAPTQRDVEDLLWTEVRLIWQRAGFNSKDFIGPKAPQIYRAPDYYAKGYTAVKGDSFAGRHRERMLFIFDEANGIDAAYFQTLRTMFDPSLGHAVLVFFNPISMTSHVYVEDMLTDDPDSQSHDGTPPWHRIRLNALDHPNIAAQLAGKPKPIPGAVSIEQVEAAIRDWCERVDGKPDTTDIEWTPGSGRFVHPGPIFQSRVLGIWPSVSDGVWSEALFNACLRRQDRFEMAAIPEVGCDTAMGKADDFHAVHGRWWGTSLIHETSNTMDPVQIAEHIRKTCRFLADFANFRRDTVAKPIDPKQVPIKIDDDGTGNAVVAILRREGYNIHAIGAGCRANRPTLYPNRRSELWFDVVDLAKEGLVDIHRLDKHTQHRLRIQLLAPRHDPDRAGRRVVEEKRITKEKIKRSPDDADAMNLAYCHVPEANVHVVEPDEVVQPIKPKNEHFGMRRSRWV
jgi:hypothetical protein